MSSRFAFASSHSTRLQGAMATTTGRRQHLPCVSDSTNFASSTSIAQLAATTSSRRGMAHARAASVPAAPVAPQQGHHRSRSWLPSFFKPSSAHQPPVKPAPEPAAPSTTRLTRRSRSNSLGASLRRKMRHLTTADEAASLPPPPRPAPPTLLPDRGERRASPLSAKHAARPSFPS